MKRSLDEQGIRCFVLDLRGVSGKAALLEAWGESVEVPQWVGRNWDAMDEAVRDLSWARAERYVVIVTGGGELASAEPKSWHMTLD
ncbi:MAG: barstar family protein, partial [Chloroflexota bacterium]|nr:barstar family protein [Chloroflexota bacterium]